MPLGWRTLEQSVHHVMRKSIATQRLLINLVTTSDSITDFDRVAFIGRLQELLGERIQGVLHTINDDKGERVEARAGASDGGESCGRRATPSVPRASTLFSRAPTTMPSGGGGAMDHNSARPEASRHLGPAPQ